MTALVMPGETPDLRARTIRARNRALGIVLLVLVALFYVLALVRVGGG